MERFNWRSDFFSPAIAPDGTIYVGSNDNKLHAFHSNGSSKWTSSTGNWVDSTPSIGSDGTIYVGSWDNKIYALNPSDGSVLWEYETNSYVTASPSLGADGRVYVGSKDSILYAFESNGSVAWEYFAGQPISSSAALGQDGTIYFGDENGTFHAVNPDGTNKWTYEVEEISDSNRSILSSPALDLSGNLYFGSGNGYCYSLSDNENNATLNWKSLSGDRVDASPVLGINDEVLFVSRDGYLRSLSTLSGGQNWETFVGDVFYSTPVVDENGRTYVIGYTGSGENHLFAIEANGTKAWDTNDTNCPFTVGGIVDSSLALSDSGKLYYGCYDNRLYCLDIGVGPAPSDWSMFQRNSLRDGAWPSYLLEGTVSPTGVGEINGTGVFNQGATATLTASPTTAGYSFEAWSGSATSSANPLSIQVNANLFLTATFSLNSTELSLTAGTGGSVTGEGNFSHGSLTAISATPDTGYSFNGWVGEGVSDPGSLSTTVLMDQNRSVSALFSLNSYELNLSTGAGGTVTGEGNFFHGTLTAISATPDTGYSFNGWVGEGVSDPGSLSTTMLMDQNRSVSATFSLKSYALTLLPGTGGTVSGEGNFSHGILTAISATPDNGYSFSGWSGEGVSDPSSASTTVLMDQNRSVSATFSSNAYELTLLTGTGGTVTGEGNFSHGILTAISATPDSGFSFNGWTGEGVSDPSSASTIVLMDQNRSVSATFSLNSYELTLLAGSGGSVTGEGNFSHGILTAISATSDSGFSFNGWAGEGVSDPSSASTTVLMDQNRSVSATFSLNSYALTLLTGTGGTVTGEGNFSHGILTAISATPDSGYSFNGWAGEGVSDPSSASTTVLMEQNRSVSATFSLNSYELTLLAGAGGSVAGEGNFSHGTLAPISATPNSGYVFLRWEGDHVSDPDEPSTTVTINQALNLTAVFETQPIGTNLLITSSSPSEGGTTSGGGSYPSSENSQISASPSAGYSFTGWSGDGVNDPSSISTTVLMSQDRNLTANFAINSYTLALNASAGGDVNGSGLFDYGSNSAISASPSAGYSFTGWSGEGVSDRSSTSTTVLMSQDRNITANFAINSYTLALNASAGGAVNGSGLFDYGSNSPIHASPSTGYSFTGWSGEGVANPFSASTTALMSEDRNLTANFDLNSYTLTIQDHTGGSITASGGVYQYGTQVNLFAVPNQGYSFIRWADAEVSNPSTLSTIVEMTEDRNVSALFELKSHSLSLDASEGGSVSGSGQFDYGSTQPIYATPSTGYSFSGWFGEGASDPSSPSTTVMMSEDHSLTANFALNLHTLTINHHQGGSITASEGAYQYGTQVKLLAIPLPGYSFSQWRGEGITNPDTLSTTVEMIDDRNISALFELNTYILTIDASEGGFVSGSGQFDYGNTVSILATPNTGYSFSGWTGEGASDPSSASTTVLMSEDRNLTATFALQKLSTLPETENLGDGWYSAWFGFFLQTESGWCFHHELQWIYPLAHENDGVWFWTTSLGWLWTDSSPWGQSQCWSESLQSWLYFQADHRQGSSFISYQSEEVIPLQ
ncbi:MAG: PQQ-binding-like beta-propeller repeat protein [Opitutales bacterium]